jgi:hypothetical protein
MGGGDLDWGRSIFRGDQEFYKNRGRPSCFPGFLDPLHDAENLDPLRDEIAV